MLKKLICILFGHRWTWKLSDVGYIDDTIPDFAKCKRCNELYKKV
jgi:hypothetical protein